MKKKKMSSALKTSGHNIHLRTIAAMKFTHKQLTPTKRVCLRLKEAREAKGMTRTEMAKHIRMSKEHIEALEECQFDMLPFTALYQKNLIKSYIKTLDMNPKEFVNQFIHEEIPHTNKKTTVPQKKSYHFSFPNLPLVIKAATIGIVFFACIGYLVIQVKHIVEPPNLAIYSPDNGSVTTEGSTKISGKTDPGVQIHINGRSVMNREDGFFEETIPLTNGVNTIMLSATKKHGKTTTETRHVVYKKDQPILSLK